MQPRQSISQLFGRTGDWLARSPRLVVGVLVLAMIVLSLLIARNGQTQNEARNIAQSEGDTLLAILQLRMTLLDLETGERGYILTQNPAYLEPYSAARRRVDREYEAVRRELLSSASTADQAQLRQFGDLLRTKLAELDHTVALARAGEFAPAATIVRANLGKRDMDAMRLQLAVLSRNQAARRKEGFDHARQVGGNLVPLILLLWFAAMLFGWAALVGERRRAATQARAEQAEELRAAHDRAKLLAAELDHRVKNLFTVVLAIIQLSQNKAATPAENLAKITARIRALMLAHNAALDRSGVAVDLRDLAERVLAPYRDDDWARMSLDGPAVQLAADQVTPIALILHEFATNAAKYGALSQRGGELELRWSVSTGQGGAPLLQLCWRESGGPAVAMPARGSGFGTQMADMASDQLGGSIVREWPEAGAMATLTFPQV